MNNPNSQVPSLDHIEAEQYTPHIRRSQIVYLVIFMLLLPILQMGFLGWYTVNKDLKYTILDAVYDGSDLIRKPAQWYLLYTNKIYSNNKQVSPDLLSFVLSHYGQRGSDKKVILSLAESMLQRGANINAYNYKGNTALHEAVLLSQIDLVRFLLKNGADPHQKTHHQPPGTARTDSLSALELARWLQENSKAGGNWQPAIDILQETSSTP